jgi:histidine decarboxylase
MSIIPGDLTRTSSKDSITRFNEFLESEIENRLKKSRQHSIGYPINFSYDYSPVSHFFHYNIINVGDSWGSSLFAPNTKDLEREVLSFFADLWGVNIDNTWAYLTQAGTEGNMQGLYVGREVARGKPVILYTTKNSHYSIVKIARILNIPLCLVESQDNGEMNYGDFDNNLAKNLDKFVLVNMQVPTIGICHL